MLLYQKQKNGDTGKNPRGPGERKQCFNIYTYINRKQKGKKGVILNPYKKSKKKRVVLKPIYIFIY